MPDLDEIEYRNNGGYASSPPDREAVAWLIAEVRRLRDIHCECEYSEPCPHVAENERLKADYAALLPDFHAAEEDIERLQAALHEHDPQSCDYCSGHPFRELPPDKA